MSTGESIVPVSLKELRACMICSLVKTCGQFEENGCENCNDILDDYGDIENVMTHTSSNFDGIISLTQPTQSWVAKWQHTSKREKGVYAIAITGKLPLNTLDLLAERGIPYHNYERV